MIASLHPLVDAVRTTLVQAIDDHLRHEQIQLHKAAALVERAWIDMRHATTLAERRTRWEALRTELSSLGIVLVAPAEVEIEEYFAGTSGSTGSDPLTTF